MAHDNAGNGQDQSDPDQQGDQQGQAADGNQDGDEIIAPPPLPTGPSIPADFLAFVNGLPGGFVTAFEADAPDSLLWSPVVLTAAPYELYPPGGPTALFVALAAPQSPPIVMAGNDFVGLINDSTAPVIVTDSATPYQYIASGMGGMTLFADSANGSFVAEGGNNIVVLGQTSTGGWNLDLLGGNNQVWGGGGNDTIQTAAGSTNLIVFGSGDDLAASAGNDLFIGGAGNDTIFATGSNDSLLGGSGRAVQR